MPICLCRHSLFKSSLEIDQLITRLWLNDFTREEYVAHETYTKKDEEIFQAQKPFERVIKRDDDYFIFIDSAA